MNTLGNIVSTSEYTALLDDLKKRVCSAQISVARSMNRGLILLYWDIGQCIAEKQKVHLWGEAVVDRIAADLRSEFPGMKGFSQSNVWRMRQLYLTCTTPEFLAQVAREMKKHGSRPVNLKKSAILNKTGKHSKTGPEFLAQAVRELVALVPWGHHTALLAKMSHPAAHLYYLQAITRFGWSRNVLLNQIKAGAYERAITDKKIHNFGLAQPEHLAEQADEMMKSSYNLEFLGIKQAIKERQLENRLILRLQQFLLELGYGFCFIGRQHRLALGNKEYFIDLLFYHRHMRALVAFELKVGVFEPEFAGKMDFYLNLLNDKERGPDDQPSIGIILCAEKDDVEVEYALKTKANPIGVAAYRLQAKLPMELKGKLPTTQQLVNVVKTEMAGT